MNTRALALLPLAAALLLSGCAQSAATPAAAPGQTPAGQLDAATLDRIAADLAGGNEQAVIIDKDSLTSQLPLAEQARKAMKVTPAACAAFAGGEVSEELEKKNIVTVALPGATALEGLQVVVASYEDRADAQANFARSEAIPADCSDFSFTVHGQETRLNLKDLEASTTAEKTSAIQTTTSIGETTIKTVAVNALEGSNVLTVAVMGGTDPVKDLARARQRVEEVLELVARAGS